MSNVISRRELLKRASIMGATVVVPVGDRRPADNRPALEFAQSAAVREPFQNLTAVESDVLEAIVARIIPSDENGMGAREARAARYIDRALGGALAASRSLYSAGLAAVDQFSRSTRGKAFTDLRADEQDGVLSEIESGNLPQYPGAAAFFTLVRAHTIQGTFCDPYYGGNNGFVGWDLIGYPGVRTLVTPDDQRLGASVPSNHRSAYDYEMFTKASAASPSASMTHGD